MEFLRLSIHIIIIVLAVTDGSIYADSSGTTRIISLTPSVTKNIKDLGMSNYLVGLTTYCTVPKDASNAEIIGTPVSPNIETIIAQSTDVIIGDLELNREPVLNKLEEAGGNVVRVGPHRNLRDIIDTLQKIAEAVGAEEQAQEMIQASQKRLETLRQKLVSLPPKKVFVEIWPKPLKTVSAESFVHNVFVEAGAVNIFEDAAISYPNVSMEAIIAKQPEYIAILTHSLVEDERIEQYRAFPALAESNIRQFDSAEITQPNLLNFVNGVEQLAAWLHPSISVTDKDQ